MKKVPYRVVAASLALLLAMAASTVLAEFKKGQKVWSKHVETNLLSEPRPLAAPQSTVGFAEKLSVLDTQGAWLRVKSKSGEGWVFQGNVAGDKPSLAPAAGLTRVEASETNTVAAARPLTPAAADYAQRHGQQDAQADIDWIDLEASRVTTGELVAYMSANRKGEYQP
jgi:hypothetical protein